MRYCFTFILPLLGLLLSACDQPAQIDNDAGAASEGQTAIQDEAVTGIRCKPAPPTTNAAEAPVEATENEEDEVDAVEPEADATALPEDPDDFSCIRIGTAWGCKNSELQCIRGWCQRPWDA